MKPCTTLLSGSCRLMVSNIMPAPRSCALRTAADARRISSGVSGSSGWLGTAIARASAVTASGMDRVLSTVDVRAYPNHPTFGSSNPRSVAGFPHRVRAQRRDAALPGRLAAMPPFPILQHPDRHVPNAADPIAQANSKHVPAHAGKRFRSWITMPSAASSSNSLPSPRLIVGPAPITSKSSCARASSRTCSMRSRRSVCIKLYHCRAGPRR